MNRYRHDYHVHTGFSGDSDARMSAVCQTAIERGIEEIAFTDHVDFGPLNPKQAFPVREYLTAIRRCRDRFEGRLLIRAGVEVGEPHLYPARTARVVASGEFDIVLGSAHYAQGMQPAWREDYFEQPLRDAYEAYFGQVVQLAREGEFDILGHLDLIKRDARRFGKVYDGPGPYADMIRAALRAVVERGKGIELNTSPLRRGQSEPCPSLEVLRWYRDLGGEILTLGSDAHSPDAVGSDLDVAVDMARAAGFERVATFRQREIDWREI